MARTNPRQRCALRHALPSPAARNVSAPATPGTPHPPVQTPPANEDAPPRHSGIVSPKAATTSSASALASASYPDSKCPPAISASSSADTFSTPRVALPTTAAQPIPSADESRRAPPTLSRAKCAPKPSPPDHPQCAPPPRNPLSRPLRAARKTHTAPAYLHPPRSPSRAERAPPHPHSRRKTPAPPSPLTCAQILRP